jgi:rhodanese-related sulfurtransferase
MIFELHHVDCLSQASDLIADEAAGVAVVIDPRRDVRAYLDAADHHGVRIEFVIETHFHADFVSGHLELSAATGALLVDTREPEEFASGHLPGAVNAPISARFAELAGKVLAPDPTVVLVTPPGGALDAWMRLARVAFDRVVGQIEHAWTSNRLRRVERLEPAALAPLLADVDPVTLRDVRERAETANGTIADAVTISLGELAERAGELDRSTSIVMYCASGVRSSVAASLLRRHGFADVSDLRGGVVAWRDRAEAEER